MKYVITDLGEVNIGNGYHADLAMSLNGKVVRAGHCNKTTEGKYEVFGESIGYHINALPEDAVILETHRSSKIDKILEDMIDNMGDGGMDVSYSGHNYESAKQKAIKDLNELLN